MPSFFNSQVGGHLGLLSIPSDQFFAPFLSKQQTQVYQTQLDSFDTQAVITRISNEERDALVSEVMRLMLFSQVRVFPNPNPPGWSRTLVDVTLYYGLRQ